MDEEFGIGDLVDREFGNKKVCNFRDRMKLKINNKMYNM